MVFFFIFNLGFGVLFLVFLYVIFERTYGVEVNEERSFFIERMGTWFVGRVYCIVLLIWFFYYIGK